MVVVSHIWVFLAWKRDDACTLCATSATRGSLLSVRCKPGLEWSSNEAGSLNEWLQRQYVETVVYNMWSDLNEDRSLLAQY